MKKEKVHKKDLVVVNKYFIPVTAGIEKNIFETYRVLVKRGWKVTIHTSTDTLSEKDILKRKDSIKGIRITRYQFNSDLIGYLPKIDWEDFSGIICLHNFYVFYWKILLKALVLKRKGKKHFAIVLTPHGGFNPEWSIFNLHSRVIKKIYHKTLGVWLINNVVDAVRAVSEWEAEEMRKQGIRKDLIEVISNGLEDEAFVNVNKKASPDAKELVKKFGRYLIQIGRVYPIKNYETTIKAMVKIPDDINYLIVGPVQEDPKNKNYKKELEGLAIRLGIEKRVHFLGVIRGVDKFYLIKKAAMMVHMAIWESFCNVVHEAMSQGTPIIVADNTALPYLVKDGINGYLVKTRDSDKLARKINYVLKNKGSKIIKAMAKINKRQSSEKSWRSVANKMHKLYLSILPK